MWFSRHAAMQIFRASFYIMSTWCQSAAPAKSNFHYATSRCNNSKAKKMSILEIERTEFIPLWRFQALKSTLKFTNIKYNYISSWHLYDDMHTIVQLNLTLCWNNLCRFRSLFRKSTRGTLAYQSAVYSSIYTDYWSVNRCLIVSPMQSRRSSDSRVVQW